MPGAEFADQAWRTAAALTPLGPVVELLDAFGAFDQGHVHLQDAARVAARIDAGDVELLEERARLLLAPRVLERFKRYAALGNRCQPKPKRSPPRECTRLYSSRRDWERQAIQLAAIARNVTSEQLSSWGVAAAPEIAPNPAPVSAPTQEVEAMAITVGSPFVTSGFAGAIDATGGIAKVGGGTGYLDVLNTAINAAGQYLAAREAGGNVASPTPVQQPTGIVQQPVSMPFPGAMQANLVPEIIAGAVANETVPQILGRMFGGGGDGSSYPRRIVKQIGEDKWGNPKFREYVYRGSPVLYSGDLAAARRVSRVSKRVNNARPRPRRRPSPTRVICGTCASVPCKCG